jgi:hypothetical protein
MISEVNLYCKKCGGTKYIGDEYHALGDMWVDVTCIKCSHSVDIRVSEMKQILSKLSKAKRTYSQRKSQNANG